MEEKIKYPQDPFMNREVVKDRLRNSLNDMRRESGRKLLTEEEWPTATEDVEFYSYASKVIDKISMELNKLNSFPKEGSVVWY